MTQFFSGLVSKWFNFFVIFVSMTEKNSCTIDVAVFFFTVNVSSNSSYAGFASVLVLVVQ